MSTQRKRRHTTSAQSGRARSFERQGTQPPASGNAAETFVDRHLGEGRGAKVAIRTLEREVTYAELAEQVNRYGNALLQLPVRRGERVLMVVTDCPEFFFLFWGAIKAGVIPVPLNTLLRANDLAFIVRDSGCKSLIYSDEFLAEVGAALAAPGQPAIDARSIVKGENSLSQLARTASPVLKAVNIDAEDDCVWLYSSGTTGEPKGMVHRHGDFAVTCRNYGVATLEAREDDVFFSVPRLYFSYGMGMAMTFPLWVGGTTVVDDRRPTPETVTEVFRACNPTIYAAVPTFYAAHLASGLLSGMKLPGLRRCVSAGEPAPPELLRRWADQTGVPIMEGLGSTEVLQMFVSNRMDDLRPGSLGKPVPGYQVQLIDEDGHELSGDATGRLLVKGDSVIRRYWNNPDKTAAAFVGDWLNTGDVCYRDADGYYFYRGRADDLLKVGGRWVAPFEVESALFEHPDVLEAAVVGRNDEEGLAKIEAWIVLREPARPSETVADEIRAYCKRKLAPYKYPRWIRFANELPKTATGKIQRFKLRAMSASEAPVADAGAASRLITIERRDRVLVVTLSRPPVNALNEEMIRRLEQVIGQAATDGTISVLHLRSSQKVFCAGADLALMKSCFESAEGLEGMIDIVRRMHRLFSLLETAPIVTVAEIGGAAVGGGLEFALACDVRIAADEAELGLPEVGLGLLPGAGGTQRLTRLCGRGAANRLILGAEIINGAEAKLLGMVQWTRPRAELAAWTRELVARIASQPRPALTAAKRCIAAQADSARDGYAEEIAATRMLYDQPETRRRVADFLSRKSD